MSCQLGVVGRYPDAEGAATPGWRHVFDSVLERLRRPLPSVSSSAIPPQGKREQHRKSLSFLKNEHSGRHTGRSEPSPHRLPHVGSRSETVAATRSHQDQTFHLRTTPPGASRVSLPSAATSYPAPSGGRGWGWRQAESRCPATRNCITSAVPAPPLAPPQTPPPPSSGKTPSPPRPTCP